MSQIKRKFFPGKLQLCKLGNCVKVARKLRLQDFNLPNERLRICKDFKTD